MNEFRITADDPRLTAYALGELEGDERQQVEAAVRADPALQAEVATIRALAGKMNDALAKEALPEGAKAPSPWQQAAIIPGRADQLDGGPLRVERANVGTLLRFARWYLVGGGLAAACFVLVLTWRSANEQPAGPAKHRQVSSVAQEQAPQPAAPPATETTVAVATAATAAPALAPTAPTGDDAKRRIVADGLLEQSKLLQVERQRRNFLAPAPVPPVEPAILGEGAQARGVVGGAARVAAPPMRSEQDLLQPFAAAEPQLDFYADSTAQGSYSATQPLSARVKHARREKPNALMASLAVPSARYAPAVEHWPAPAAAGQPFTQEAYAFRADNDFLAVASHPRSTFAVDVDTASYANVRRMLRQGQLPPADAVRIEELVNYFPYAYPAPGEGRDEGVAAPEGAFARGQGRNEGVAAEVDAPFAASLEVAEAPWAPSHRLVRIGLKAREVSATERGAANLVFLLDVSGSMNQPNKLPLVQEAMRLLLERLRPDDRVAIVTYAGSSTLALPSTPVARVREIRAAIEQLRPGGSTNGGMGLQLAYDIAKANFVAGGVNRVLLCTDGDFNVGVTSEGELVRLIAEKAKSGVFLTVLGFGMGNYKDALLQQIADRGNGSYGYIDSRREAEKLLLEQVSGTLVTVAKDVKLQLEFNPAQVASYRLLGYEKRLLKPEDFNNDAVDAGEVGAGHTVTALYEIVPAGGDAAAPDETAELDPLKYQPAKVVPGRLDPATATELLTLKVRYQEPAGSVSRKLEFPLVDRGGNFAGASADFRFASAVAAFGMILRDSPHRGATTYADVIRWAESAVGSDAGGYRTEFVELVKQAERLAQP